MEQPLWRSPVEAVDALSHQEHDAVVAAYARSDLFAKRRSLMEQQEAWLRDHYSDALPARPPASDTALVADALMDDHVDTKRMYPIAVRAKDMGDIVDHLTNRRMSATHRVKALKRGGWSIGKVKEQRVYWR